MLFRSAGPRTALADLLAKSGDSAGAAAQLEEAVKRQPDSFELRERLGDLEAAHGQRAEAAAAWQAALEHAPDSADRKRIAKKLRTSGH